MADPITTDQLITICDALAEEHHDDGFDISDLTVEDLRIMMIFVRALEAHHGIGVQANAG